MTTSPIGSLTAGQQKADAVSPTPEQQKAARDFEAIFLRQLLSSLEKGSGVSGGQSSGGAVFRSMMVSAMADKAAEGGGIGLSELILKAMMPPTPQGKIELSQPVAATQGAQPSSASTSATDPLDRLASTVAMSGMTPGGAFPGGAFPSGAGVSAPGLLSGSARLGAPSQVLTEARPARMLPATASRQQASPIQPEGGTR
jgi:Rod binding domain-containing protein